MCVFLLDVFAAPQQETTLASPRRTSRKPLPGPAALRSRRTQLQNKLYTGCASLVEWRGAGIERVGHNVPIERGDLGSVTNKHADLGGIDGVAAIQGETIGLIGFKAAIEHYKISRVLIPARCCTPIVVNNGVGMGGCCCSDREEQGGCEGALECFIHFVELIGNRFRPSGKLAQSLKLEAVISMPGRCQMRLCESSSRHSVVWGAPRTIEWRIMRAPRAHLAAAGVVSFLRTPVRGRSRGRDRRAKVR